MFAMLPSTLLVSRLRLAGAHHEMQPDRNDSAAASASAPGDIHQTETGSADWRSSFLPLALFSGSAVIGEFSLSHRLSFSYFVGST